MFSRVNHSFFVSTSMGKNISQTLKQDILNRLQHGKSTRSIAKEFLISKSSVHRIAKSNNLSLKATGGRSRKLTPQDERLCARKIVSGESKSVVELTKTLKVMHNIDVDRRTVARALNKTGLRAGESQKRPGLSKKNIKDRLEWAKMHKDWTVADWNRVIFSDESKINRFNSDGRSWSWYRDVNQLEDRTVNVTYKHGGGGIMVWGCMTSLGVGYLCKIDGIMDRHLYETILQEDLLNTIGFYGFDKSRVIFQHDNDPKHKASSIQQWLSDHELRVLPWPAQSPDMNPIEHLWAHVKRQLNKYMAPPNGINELWERIQEVWNSIDTATCKNLIESMPRRVAKVIEAKGKWTKY